MLGVQVRNLIIGIFVVVGLFFVISVTHAQLPNSTTWTSAGSGNSTVVESTYGVGFSYDYPYTNSYEERNWEFSAIATDTGVLNYNWDYTGMHAWFQARAKVTAFVENDGVRSTTVLYNNDVYGNFDMSGTSSLQLTAGDTYGFTITGYNFDGSKHLRGSLKVQTSPVIKAALTGTKGKANWYTSNVGLVWTIIDMSGREIFPAGCGPVSANEDTSAEGVTYTCEVASTGGMSSKSVTIQVDATAPVTIDNAPADPVSNEIQVDLTATDNGSGVANTYYTINEGPTRTGTQVNLATHGVHSISYWSVDHAGNVEETHNIIVKVGLPPINEDGHFDIQDLVILMNQGTLQQRDMNNDGIINADDRKIMLNAITPIHSSNNLVPQ